MDRVDSVFVSSSTFANPFAQYLQMDVNIIQLYQNLTDAGVHSIISAPPNQIKGAGSKEEEPKPLEKDGCDYQSCPPFSPATGVYTSYPAFNVSEIQLALYT